MVCHGRHLLGELWHERQGTQDGGLVVERVRSVRQALLDDVRRSVPGARDEYAVASRHVEDREVLLDDGARLDKTARQEIVGNV